MVVWALQVLAGLGMVLWAVARVSPELAVGVAGVVLLAGAVLERRVWKKAPLRAWQPDFRGRLDQGGG
jgi:hypothetical protein